eukprot:EC849879.1.p1 GENE.EC849879.1~~EC849879.1.p1  ORF type:complete len:124 (-),score=18.69 EC849879.1:46-417(-)
MCVSLAASERGDSCLLGTEWQLLLHLVLLDELEVVLTNHAWHAAPGAEEILVLIPLVVVLLAHGLSVSVDARSAACVVPGAFASVEVSAHFSLSAACADAADAQAELEFLEAVEWAGGKISHL